MLKMEKLLSRDVDRSFKLINLCERGSVENAKMAYDQMIGEC